MPVPPAYVPPLRPRPGLKPAKSLAIGLGLCLALTADAGLADQTRPRPRPDPAASQPMADNVAGVYLAARLASSERDFGAAAPLYTRALALDPLNPALLDGAVTARLATGDVAGAAQAGRALLAQRPESQTARLAVIAGDALAGDYDAILADLGPDSGIGQMTDGLIRAWTALGKGSMSDALAAFDKLAANNAMQGFALYHKALAMALSGDFEGAEAILSGPDLGPIRDTRRAVLARVQALAQLDRRDEALAVLNLAFPPGMDAAMEDLRLRLSGTDPVNFDIVTKPLDGVAEVLFDMANALSDQADDTYVLVFARTAAALRPDHLEATMLSASLLQRLNQPDLAAQVYGLIPSESPAFIDAEIGRANAALMAGRGEDAIAILQALAEHDPKSADVLRSLADTLRRQRRFAEAVPQYDAAIALLAQPNDQDWSLFYARAIALYEEKRWPEAERDFLQALQLNPNQPQVLNYLGYSYVDRGENLEEALKLIQRAVLAAPDQGYIVDSLAWALFRLGRFREAVVPMERASQLEPIDPIVTDHLGDVYWAVGRQMEARFQWRRALSFNPTEKDATRIRRKLEVGLDQVVAEEKAAAEAPAEVPVETVPEAPATDGNGG